MTTAMTMAPPLLAELEREAETTRRFLERLPADKLAWRPHPRSMTLGQLALHIAETPGGVAAMSRADAVPLPDFGNRPQPESVEQILSALARSVTEARQVLAELTDARAAAPWRVMDGDRVALEFTRAGLIRAIMCSHLYHHRGQLSVYLRLLDIPVPSAYGPTADENPLG